MSESNNDLKNEESEEEFTVVEFDSSEYSYTGTSVMPSFDDLLSTIDRSIVPEEGSLFQSNFMSTSISSTQLSNDTIPKKQNVHEVERWDLNTEYKKQILPEIPSPKKQKSEDKGEKSESDLECSLNSELKGNEVEEFNPLNNSNDFNNPEYQKSQLKENEDDGKYDIEPSLRVLKLADGEIMEQSKSSKFNNSYFPEPVLLSNVEPSEDHLEADFGFINMENNNFASLNKSKSISSRSNFSKCKVSSDSETDVLSILIDENAEHRTIKNPTISNQDILSLAKPFKIVLNRLTKEELTIYRSVNKQNEVVCTLETSLFPYGSDDSDVISKSDDVKTNKKKKLRLIDSSEEDENRLGSSKKLRKSFFKKVLNSEIATNEHSSFGIKQKKNKHKDLPSSKQKKYYQKRGRPKKLSSFEQEELSESEKETAVDNLLYKKNLCVAEAEDSDNTSDVNVNIRLPVEKIRKLSSTGEDIYENEEKDLTENIISKLTFNKSIRNQTATSENLEKVGKKGDQLKKLFFPQHETPAETKKETVLKTYRSKKLQFKSGTDDSDLNSSASDIEKELPDRVKKLSDGIELPINKKVMKTKSKNVSKLEKSYARTVSKSVFTKNSLPNSNYKDNVSENVTSTNDLCSAIKPCRVVLYKLSKEEINLSKTNNLSNGVHKTKTLLCAKGGNESNIEASNGFSYSSEKPIFKSLENRKLSASTESSRKSCESTDSSLPSIPVLDKLFSKNRRYGKLKSSVKQSQQKSSSMVFFKASPDKNGNEDGLCIPLTSDVDISEESENESEKPKLSKKKSHQKSSSKMATLDKDENAKSLYTQYASDIDSSEEMKYESKKPESLKKQLHQKSSPKKSTCERNKSAKSFDTSHTSDGEISEEFKLESKIFELSKKKSLQKSSSKMASEDKDTNAKSLYTKTASDVDSSEVSEYKCNKPESSKKNLHRKSSYEMITQEKNTRTRSLNSQQTSDVDISEESEHEGKKPKFSTNKSHEKLFKKAAEGKNANKENLDTQPTSDVDISEESEHADKKLESFKKKFHQKSLPKNAAEDENSSCLDSLHASDVDSSEEWEYESKKSVSFEKFFYRKSSSKIATREKNTITKIFNTPHTSDVDISEQSEYESKKPQSSKKSHQKLASKKATQDKDAKMSYNLDTIEESEYENKKFEFSEKKMHQKSSFKNATRNKNADTKSLEIPHTSDEGISKESEPEGIKPESSKKKSHQKPSSKKPLRGKDAIAKSFYTRKTSHVDASEDSEYESKNPDSSKKKSRQKLSSKKSTQEKEKSAASSDAPHTSDSDKSEEWEHEDEKPESFKKKSHQKTSLKKAAEIENSSTKSFNTPDTSDIDVSKKSEYESKKPQSSNKSHQKPSSKKATQGKDAKSSYNQDTSEESEYESKKVESSKKKMHKKSSFKKATRKKNANTKSLEIPLTSDEGIYKESEPEDKKPESFKKKSHQETSLKKAVEDENSSTESFYTPHTSDANISEESEHKGEKLESSKRKLHIISSTENVSQDKDMGGLLTHLTSDVDIFEESENEIIKSGKNLVSLIKPCKVILNKINVAQYFKTEGEKIIEISSKNSAKKKSLGCNKSSSNMIKNNNFSLTLKQEKLITLNAIKRQSSPLKCSNSIVKEPAEKQNVLNRKRIISSSDEESDSFESLSTSNIIKTNKRARLVTSSNVTGIRRMRGKMNKRILSSGSDDRITVKNAPVSKNEETDNSKTLSFSINCIEKVYKTHKKKKKGIVSSDDDEIISVKSIPSLEETNTKIVFARQSSSSSINSANEISKTRCKEIILASDDDSISFKNKLTFKQSKTNIKNARVRLKSSPYINSAKKIHKTSGKRKNISSSEDENINLQPTTKSSDKNHRRSSSCSSVDISSSIEKVVNKNSAHTLRTKKRFAPKEKVGEKFSSKLKCKRLSLNSETQICDTIKDSDKNYLSDIDELVYTGHKRKRHVNTKTISRSSSSSSSSISSSASIKTVRRSDEQSMIDKGFSSKLKCKRLSLNSKTQICDTNKDTDKNYLSDIDELVYTGHKKKRHVDTKTISRSSSSSSSLSSSASIKTVRRSDEQSMIDKGFFTSKLNTEKTFVSNLKRKRSVSDGCLNSNLHEDSNADLEFKGKSQRRSSSVSSENSFVSVETASSNKLTFGYTSSISSSDGISHKEFESDFLGKLKKDKASKLKRTLSSKTKNRKSCITSHFKAEKLKMKTTRDNELLSLITPCKVILHRLPDEICFENWTITRKDSDFLGEINDLQKSLSVGENEDSCKDLNFFEKTSLVCAEPELLRNKDANSDTKLSATIDLSKATLSDSSSGSEQSYEESRYYKELEKEKIFEQADLALAKQNNQEDNSITSEEGEILCDKNKEQSYKKLKNFKTLEINKKNSDLTDVACENQADNSIISENGGTQYDQDVETDKKQESYEIDVNNAKEVIHCCEINKNKEIDNELTGLGNNEIQYNKSKVNDKAGNKGLNNLANLKICSCETNQKEESNRSDDRLTNKKNYDELTNLAKEDIAFSNANRDVESDIELTKILAKEVNERGIANRNEESDNELSILAKEDIECSKEDGNEESDSELTNLEKEVNECSKANRNVESDIELTNLAKEDNKSSKVDGNEESANENDSELTNLNCVKAPKASENLVSCEKEELQSVKTNINDKNSQETSYKLKHSSCEKNYEQNDSFIASNIETQSSVPDKNCQTDKEMATISCDKKCDSKNSQVNLDKLKNFNSKIQEGQDNSLIDVAKKGVKKKQKKNKFTSLERQLMSYANLRK